ncbi:MAG: type II toxin-antitoxin system YafQ family toxin [bacterium]
MLRPAFTKQFERDLKKALKRGKDKQRIKFVITRLINEEELEPKYKEHKLVGQYKGRRECHIEPDWLLIYKIEGQEIIFERTGTHSDLF